MAMRRTTMYSIGGKKPYAARAADGAFTDVQTYARAHRADMAHESAAEKATAARKAVTKKSPAKKAAKKSPAGKAAKKATRKKAAKKSVARKGATKRASKKSARRK